MMKLEAFLPAISWLKTYRRQDFSADLMAGLIVAVMLVPQGMAYALLAGMPPVTGLYAATLPLIVYALFGTSRQLAVGPVAIVSLLTFAGISSIAEPGSSDFVVYAAVLALMVGLIQFALGLLRAGFITNFLSHAVISGFTSAAAIVIGLSQLKHLLGINLPASDNVFVLLYSAIIELPNAHGLSLALGSLSIIILLTFKRLAKRFPAPLLVVVLASLMVYGLNWAEQGVNIVGAVPQGLPSLAVPAVSLEVLLALLPTALTISFISFMESIAVAQSIATREKYKLDANKELLGLGLANIAASVFRAFPVTGGFSRTAINYQAGAKTPLASIITAGLVIITLLFLTPLFTYLPKAVLAAIIIVAVVGLIDIKEPVHLFKLKPIDGWTLLLTFISTLILGVETGILVGIGFSLLVFVWRSAYPHIAELGYLVDQNIFRNVRRFPEAQRYTSVLMVRIDAPLYFVNMAYLETRLNHTLAERPGLRYIVLDFGSVNDMDAVALTNLEQRMLALQEQGIDVYISGMIGPVRDLVAKAGWNERFAGKIHYTTLKQVMQQLELFGSSVAEVVQAPDISTSGSAAVRMQNDIT